MTDIIPKASSGRYMGISNVATACAGPVALLTGGTLMDIVGGPYEAGSGLERRSPWRSCLRVRSAAPDPGGSAPREEPADLCGGSRRPRGLDRGA